MKEIKDKKEISKYLRKEKESKGKINLICLNLIGLRGMKVGEVSQATGVARRILYE